jgi:hypothetical protein
MIDLDKSALKRSDLRCSAAPISLNPNDAPKVLFFNAIF